MAVMTTFVVPLLIGIVGGLRAMTAPAAVSWASRIGWLDVAPTPFAFFGYTFTPWVFTALALGELVTDQLPTTPSRTVPVGFGARIIVGALCGGAIGASGGALVSGLIAGIAGSIIGTLGGRAFRGAARCGVRKRPTCGVDRGCGGRRRRVSRHGGATVMRFDAIIIGAGQAGPPLAGRLTAAGMKVALVERKLFGGTCVNTGCMPTKTLVASAYAAHLVQRAADYGIVLTGATHVDMPKVKARADAVTAKARSGVERWLRNMDGCTVFQGHARFEASDIVRVDQEQLTAARIFINVGGRALVPDMPGIGDVPYLTNTSILALDTVPTASRRRGRKLCRPRVRPDVSAVWRPGDRCRDGAAPDRARGRGCLPRSPKHPGRRGHYRSHGCKVHRPCPT